MKKIVLALAVLAIARVEAYSFKLKNNLKAAFDVHYYYWDGSVHEASGEILNLKPDGEANIKTPLAYCINNIWLKFHDAPNEDKYWFKAGSSICFDGDIIITNGDNYPYPIVALKNF